MTKNDILNECARRCGDEDATFISGKLSTAFDFVLLELHQRQALGMVRKEKSFTFSDSGLSVSNGLLNINTATLLGKVPDSIVNDLVVPAWGPVLGVITRVEDSLFRNRWLAGGTNTGKPRIWRVYPSLAQLQLYPAPDSDSLSATCLMEWESPPTALSGGDTITEILETDLPTLLAGLYRYGIMYRDETLNDTRLAETRWLDGCEQMKMRRLRALHYGRPTQIRYREF